MKKKGEPSIRRVQTTCVVVMLLYNNATKSPEWTITGGCTHTERERERQRFSTLVTDVDFTHSIERKVESTAWRRGVYDFPWEVSSLHLSRFGRINSYELLVLSVFLFDDLVEGQHISIMSCTYVLYESLHVSLFKKVVQSNKSPWWSPRQLGSTQKGRRNR